MQETKADKGHIQGWLEVGTMETTNRIWLLVDMPWKNEML